MTLRPEGTAGVMRAYIEHGLSVLPQPLKLFYFGPMFRYEQPQSGRYRQFYQFGFEVIGESDPVIDAQLIKVFYNIYSELGIKGLTVQINSIGCKVCRP
ncbi:MAG: Histidine-tRNA ligase, partial [Candidatus Azambacteria bacterium GW2011_GWB2_46_37]